MTEKTIYERLIELQGVANLYSKQLRMATIAAYYNDQPPQVLIDSLNEALALLNASTPKILIVKSQIKVESENHDDQPQ